VNSTVVDIEELDCPWFMSSTLEWFLNLTHDAKIRAGSDLYGKWPVQASKQANIHTHGCNEVALVWGSLRLVPVNHNPKHNKANTETKLPNLHVTQYNLPPGSRRSK